MCKVFKFKVEIEELENKIWREIEIMDESTVADLAYTILATFNSLAYHLYNIKYNNRKFDCWVDIEDSHSIVPSINAVITKLKDLKLEEKDKLEMEYDYGSSTIFQITYLGLKKVDKSKLRLYPRIVDGAGKGMVDDICSFELKKIVDDIDKKGYSEYYFAPGYGKNEKYDYRDFELKNSNRGLKSRISKIKKGYEEA